MTEVELLQTLIGETSAKLRRAVSGVPEELFGRRSGAGLNPVGFIYFHVLRCWDEDMNVLCRDQPPEGDAWHRAGLSRELGYEPLGRGKGGRGVGVGFDDAEVDVVPKNFNALSRYHDLLDAETQIWLESLTPEELHRERRDAVAASRGMESYTAASQLRMIAIHHAEHSGDIKFVKGMLGMPDPTYPGPAEPALRSWPPR